MLSIITQIGSPIIKSSFRWEKNLSLSHKLITITILLSLLLLANTTTQQNNKKEDAFLTYENYTYAIRIQYLLIQKD